MEADHLDTDRWNFEHNHQPITSVHAFELGLASRLDSQMLKANSAVRLSCALVEPFAACTARPLSSDER